MSTRNPMNKRSQAQLKGEVKGMARKSSASAKPARPAASSVRVVSTSGKAKRAQMEAGEDLSGLSKEEKKARKQERRLQEDRISTAANYLLREDETYHKRRRVFWTIMGVGIAVFAAVWISLALSMQAGENSTLFAVQNAGIILTYVAIIAAFIYDFARVRPLRSQYRAIAEGMSEGKLVDLIERYDAKEAAERAAKKAKKGKGAK